MNSRLALHLSLALMCLSPHAAHAQGTEPAPEILARDMREEIVRIDVTVKDLYNRQETRQIPITIYRPAGDGPFPLVVFNHGRPPQERRHTQGRFQPEHAARYLVAKGFVVLAPMRVGYWETYGDFDPEYSGPCNSMQIGPMSIAASDQVLATVEYARTLRYVDASRWLVVGQSVGGLTAVATVGRKPAGLLGGINFAGGTGGNPDKNPGRPCSPGAITSYWSSIARNAAVPMLWLYWKNDKYWGEEIPREWHKAWVNGGGKAEFRSFPPTGEDGHRGLTIDMNSWLPAVDEFLNQLGFTQAAIVARPAASGFADLRDVGKVPVSESGKTNGYPKFLAAKSPRAFAVGERGGWGYATGDYVTGRAIGYCQRSGQTCRLYAVDDDVVWK
jgi:dienelactone hydrolase